MEEEEEDTDGECVKDPKDSKDPKDPRILMALQVVMARACPR